MKNINYILFILLAYFLTFDLSAKNQYQYSNKSDCRQTDSLALIAFYNSTNGENWTNKWDLELPIDTWYGVSLNTEGCVSSLVLVRNKLDGFIPPEIGDLNSLEILNLSSNFLLDPDFYGLYSEVFYLDNIGIEGSIPSEIGNLSKLVELNLSGNNLSQIPSSIGNLNKLEILNLSGNGFCSIYDYGGGGIICLGLSGLPPNLGNLSSLKELHLSGSAIRSPIPAELGSLTNLEILNLSGNELYGEIPSELGNLTKLVSLNLGNNDFRDPCYYGGYIGGLYGSDCITGLEGNIPSSLGSLENLTYLNLDGNKLTGSIPQELGDLSELTTLYLANNEVKWSCSGIGLLPLCNQLINTNIDNINSQIFTWEAFCESNGNICEGFVSFQCHQEDIDALRALYNATDGDNWINNTGWEILIEQNLGDDCNLGSLYGVTLNEEARVSKIDLRDNNLEGSIPVEFALLSKLDILILKNNSLTGNIPNELFDINTLTYLNLSANTFVGAIPLEIGNLGNLIHLNLEANELTENIPTEIGNLTNLTVLDLGTNLLSGEIPKQLGNLKQLNYLNLGFNTLNGEVAVELANLNNLTDLLLNNNLLSGEIPVELGSLSNLYFLSLAGNLLSGEIPSELGNLSNLQMLNLGSNTLSGGIPAELSNLNQLTTLEIPGNNLSGCYPLALESLCKPALTVSINDGNNFDATWEEFCESYTAICIESVSPNCHPDDVAVLKIIYNEFDGDNWTKNYGWAALFDNQNLRVDCNLDNLYGVELDYSGRVSNIYLENNNLTGFIPPEIGNIQYLESLSLSSNNIEGTIPPEIGNLEYLEYLSLSDNNIEGAIPPEIGNLSNLYALYLSNNDLTGIIPPEIGKLFYLSGLYLDNNNLEGTFPAEISDISSALQALNVTNNNLSGCYFLDIKYLCSQYYYFIDIDTGNNFDASWDDFCESNEGVCIENTGEEIEQPCLNQPGEMQTSSYSVCDGAVVYVREAEASSNDENSIKAYVLHEEEQFDGINYIAINEQGRFTSPGPDYSNRPLYISAVIGTPGENGLPMLEDECTAWTPFGAEYTFFDPVTFNIENERCENGQYFVDVSLSGGFSKILPNLTYRSVFDGINLYTNISAGEMITFGPYQGAGDYYITAYGAKGCPGELAGEYECGLQNRKAQIKYGGNGIYNITYTDEAITIRLAKVFNMNGQWVPSITQIDQNNCEVQLLNQPAGMYFVQLVLVNNYSGKEFITTERLFSH